MLAPLVLHLFRLFRLFHLRLVLAGPLLRLRCRKGLQSIWGVTAK